MTAGTPISASAIGGMCPGKRPASGALLGICIVCGRHSYRPGKDAIAAQAQRNERGVWVCVMQEGGAAC